MLIGAVQANDRFNNPPQLSKVGLQVFFMQDGQYQDPYQISAVSIFKASKTYNPETILNADELIASSVSGSILMNFANSSADVTNAAFNVSNCAAGASGIYRLSKGQYAVLLDGEVSQSGVINLYGNNSVVKNTVSNIGDYVDVWTVKMVAGSELETIINYFTLTRGNFFTITEPLLFRSRTRLLNNSVVLGSKVDLKIDTEITVENKNITDEVKNVITEAAVRSPSIEIYKLNDETNLPARVTVSSYSDTSSLTTINSGDTIVFTWDTEELKTHPQALLGKFGGIVGMYAIQVKYSLFNQRIVSPLMHLTVE